MEQIHLSEKQHTTAVFSQNKNRVANELQKKIAAIWGKVELLKEVKYISTEEEKFSVAYRFMEIELEKVCKERELLKNSLINVIQSYTR